jgi:hypothetical protein
MNSGVRFYFADAERMVRTLKYKPGYRISIRHGFSSAPCNLRVQINYVAPDADAHLREGDAAPTVPVSFVSMPEDIDSAEHFLHVVRNAIREVEDHEADEWFRVAGKHYRAPHGARS